jgi:hypothetical protein
MPYITDAAREYAKKKAKDEDFQSIAVSEIEEAPSTMFVEVFDLSKLMKIYDFVDNPCDIYHVKGISKDNIYYYEERPNKGNTDLIDLACSLNIARKLTFDEEDKFIWQSI